MRVLFISAYSDGTDVGESYFSFRWARELAARTDLTLLSLENPQMRVPLQAQLPNTKVVSWPEPPGLRKLERLNGMLKPGYFKFYINVRRFLRDALNKGKRFEVIHQMGPNSLRYPCPAIGFGIPVVHGPMQGSLPTPPGFVAELDTAPWYMRLRALDRLRFRYHPWLRHSLRNVDLLLVGAPYVLDLLEGVSVKRVETICHLGVDGLVRHPERTYQTGRLRLVHVARAVRTKGLRDSIRALAHVRDIEGVTLDVAGEGEETETCKALSRSLGLERRVRFHGRLPRQSVEGLYARLDALLFPSFREPQGDVVLEAMRHGLPIITTNLGGPAYLVDDSSGFRLDAQSPDQLSSHIATVLRRMVENPELCRRLSDGAYERAVEMGSWDIKMKTVLEWYEQLSRTREKAPRLA